MDLDTVVRECLEELKSSGARAISESDLRTLEFCFAGDSVLDTALECLDKHAVTRVQTRGHGGRKKRICHQVASSMPAAAKARGAAPGDAGRPWTAENSEAVGDPFGSDGKSLPYSRANTYNSAASGIDAHGNYTVLPNYCTCVDFNNRVLRADLAHAPGAPVPFRASSAATADGTHDRVLRPRYWCKHLLAACLADAIGVQHVREVSDVEFGDILLAATTGGGAP